MSSHRQLRDVGTDVFDIYIDEPDRLWSTATRATSPSQLVITPVELHQRNIEQRLREHDRPKSDFDFTGIRDVAARIMATGDGPTRTLDRLDRLSLIRRLVDDGAEGLERLEPLFGVQLADHADELERGRVELALVTGFIEERLAALDDAAEATSAVVQQDTTDLLCGLSSLQAHLREAAITGSAPDDRPRAVSETDLLSRATQRLSETPACWNQAYPDVETLAVAGASMLSAPLEDFCRLVARDTSVTVELYLRPATGPAIREQLAEQPAVTAPGTQVVYDGDAQ